MAASRPSWSKLVKLLITVAIGTVGGMAAAWLQLPLPWMIGSMVATTAAALSGVPLAMPKQLRAVMVAVLGVMLGSGFSPEILSRFAEWLTSLLLVIGYIVVAGAVCFLYLKRVTTYDATTAYFCSMPGGLTEMILAGDELGGDTRIISLVHALRVLLVQRKDALLIGLAADGRGWIRRGRGANTPQCAWSGQHGRPHPKHQPASQCCRPAPPLAAEHRGACYCRLPGWSS